MIKRPTKFFYGYVIVVALWLMYFISMAIPTYGVTVLNAKMVLATGMDSAVVGTGVSIATLLQGLSAPIVGSMIKKRGGVRIPYIIGTFLVLAGTLLMAFFAFNEVCFVIYYGVLMGAGMGFGGILSLQSCINEWFDRHKSLAMGIAMSAGGFAGLVLPLVLGAVADRSSWQGGWLFSSICCAFSCLVAIFLVVNKPSDIGEVPDGKKAVARWAASEKGQNTQNDAGSANSQTAEAVKAPAMPLEKVYKSPAFYALAFNVGAKWALYYAFTGHIVIFLMQEGIDSVTAALVISAFSIASLFGRLLIGMVPETILSPKNNNAFGTLIFTAGMIALMVLPITRTTICIFGAIMGFTFGTTMIGFPVLVSQCFGKENFPVVNARMAMIQNVLGAVGPLIVGFIASASGSYPIAYWIFIIISLVSGIGVLTIRKKAN